MAFRGIPILNASSARIVASLFVGKSPLPGPENTTIGANSLLYNWIPNTARRRDASSSMSPFHTPPPSITMAPAGRMLGLIAKYAAASLGREVSVIAKKTTVTRRPITLITLLISRMELFCITAGSDDSHRASAATFRAVEYRPVFGIQGAVAVRPCHRV